MDRIDVKDSFKSFKDVFFSSKKYLIVYFVLTSFLFFTLLSKENILYPKSEILVFCLVIFLGVFCIVYYFMHKSDEELYKVAFVVILCFGILCCIIVPISDVSDEWEHFARAEITSQGVLFPHWTGEDMNLTSSWKDGKFVKGAGYETIRSTFFFWGKNREKTVFETPHDTKKINYGTIIIPSAFEQNPFWGYIPQAIGIFLAKILDLNQIWMMWLGRIFNLLLYAVLISLAVKKTPYLKIPLIAVACVPISIYQAASVSIDSMIFGLGILAVAYYIFMSQADRGSLDNKEIVIYSVICLLLGLCKLPYLAFIFLLLFVPQDNFKSKNSLPLCLLCIFCLSVVGLMWSSYSEPTLMHSWRARNTAVNSTLQANYIANHPSSILTFFKQIFSGDIVFILDGWFKFFGAAHHPHYSEEYGLITRLIQIFLSFVLLAYPTTKKFDSKTKWGALFVVLVIYVGTCVVQWLSWANVGQIKLGISLRYFIPLFALVPIIFNFNIFSGKNEKFDNCAMLCVICFMSVLILRFVTRYY